MNKTSFQQSLLDDGGVLARLAKVARHELLDLGNGQARVQALGTSLGAVHDGVATVDGEVVLKFGQSFVAELVARVNDPSVGLQEDGRAQVLVRVPPVRGTRGRTACAQDALVETVDLLAVGFRLVELLLTNLDVGVLSLQERLDRLVLSIKVAQVWHEVLDDVHMWQRVDLGRLARIVVDLGKTRERVGTVDVHGARAANAFAARSSERQSGILLVLDLDQGVQNHHSAVVQIDLVGLEIRLLAGDLGVPSVDGELLDALGLRLSLASGSSVGRGFGGGRGRARGHLDHRDSQAVSQQVWCQ